MASDKRKATHFYCGTSNVVLPVPNKNHFPPEFQNKSRLSYYASLFNTVEINSSFYKIPQRGTVERWAEETPDHFRFSFKLWKGITHARELSYDEADLHKFMNSVNGITAKKGCILIQLPASIKVSYCRKVRILLDQLSHTNEIDQWKIAIEFRDKSWYNDTVYEMLEGYKVCIVIHDMPASATPQIDMAAAFCYFRFHGEKGDYTGSYTDDILEYFASRITHELNASRYAYVYFNNTIGQAVHNAAILNQYVTST